MHQHADDEAWLALALTLPDERVLGQAMSTVDVENLHAARELARHDLACRHYAEFRTLYLARREDSYSDNPQAIDRRTLKNTALSYLVASGEAQAISWAASQFHEATNMSDAQAAFACLLDVDCPETDEVVTAFYERWKDTPLVIDKWFALQAMANRHDIVARVEELTRHEDFGLSNPNRVRSLIGMFSQRNQAGFHRDDGSGYKLLTNVIVSIDGHNPQLASRLTTPLSQAHRYDETRAHMMRAALKRLLDLPNTSADVYEIAARSLGIVTPPTN